MTQTPVPPPGGLIGLIAGARTAWGYFFGTVVLIALAFSWLAENWQIAQPVIEHPVTMFLGAMAFMAVGAGLIYLLLMSLVVAPLRIELAEAKADIDALRATADQAAKLSHQEERDLRDLIAAQAAQIAELKVSVSFLKDQLAAMTRPIRAPRTPKA